MLHVFDIRDGLISREHAWFDTARLDVARLGGRRALPMDCGWPVSRCPASQYRRSGVFVVG